MKLKKWLNSKKKTKNFFTLYSKVLILFQDFFYIYTSKIKVMRIKFVLFVLMFIFLSCNKNILHDDFDSNFENNRWEENDVRVFEFENKQSNEACDLKLHFGHISGFQFKEVPLEVEITHPNNKVEILPIVVKLIEESGKDIGDCTGDICDVFQTIKTFEILEKGKYKVAVKSKFTGPYLPNVLGVGIVVEKQK